MSDLLTLWPEWMRHAACAGISNPDVFFPPGNSTVSEQALAICAQCPVRQECRQDAIEQNQLGIWGGTTRPERRAVKEGREYTPQTGSFGQALINAQKTHCKRDHEFTAENTRWYQGKRSCVACYRLRMSERKAANARKRVTHGA
jgi:hypothetical protein